MATEPNELRRETIELVADVELVNNLLHELNRYLDQLRTCAQELLRVEVLLDDPLIMPREKHLSNVKFFYGTRNDPRLLVGSPRASTTPIYSPGSSSTPIYSSGSSSTPIYSPGSSSTPIYSRNAECSNCKHLLDKITVLEATVDMYMHPEQHTVNSAALFHEVYNNMGKT
ncbi:hypothetical protein Tco_0012846 [Tanacetum coccineum]